MTLSGWNTWDTYSVTSIVHAETGLRLRAGVINTTTGECRNVILLPDMEPAPDLVGPRTADGSYIEWRVQQEDYRLLFQFAAKGKSFIWHIVPEVWPKDHQLAVDISYAWGEILNISRQDGCWTSGDFEIRPITEAASSSLDDRVVFDISNGAAVITANAVGSPAVTNEASQSMLETARKKY